MLGPFLQGFMLVGVIYLYSKSILSLINDYYREEYKNQFGKDLKAFSDIEKSKENVDNVEDKKGMIVGKKDIIPSPVIEGIPDIFNNLPEGTYVGVNHEKSPIKKCHSIEKLTDENLIEEILTANNKEQKNKNAKYAKLSVLRQHNKQQQHEINKRQCSINSKSDISISSSNSKSNDINNKNKKLLDFTESHYSKSYTTNKMNGIRTDSTKEAILNLLPENKFNYKQIKNQQVATPSEEANIMITTAITNDVCDEDYDDDDGDEIGKMLQKMEICNYYKHQQSHNNHYDEKNHRYSRLNSFDGNHIHNQIILKGDERVSTEKESYKRNEISKKILLRAESNKQENFINDISNVCTVRRKSVSEMIEYWNNQLYLSGENSKNGNKVLSEEKEDSSDKDSLHLDVNGVL